MDDRPTSEVLLHLSRVIDFSGVAAWEAAKTESTDEYCLCLNPRQSVLAMSLRGAVAEYDLVSGCKLGSTEAGDPPIALTYTTDGATLIAVTRDKAVVAWETQFWKKKVLLPAGGKADKTGQAMLLAVSPGPRPAVFFCTAGTKDVRLVLTMPPPATKGTKDRQGGMVKTDAKRAVLAMAGHPSDSQVLFTLLADGALTANAVSIAQRTLTTIWAVSVEDAPHPLSQAVLLAEAHPGGGEGALLLAGTSTGCSAAFETFARQEASLVGRQEGAGEGHAVIGAGLSHAAGHIYTFTLNPSGEMTLHAWQLLTAAAQPGGSGGSCWEALNVSAAGLQETAHGVGSQQSASPKGAWGAMWAPGLLLDSGSKRDVREVLVHRASGVIVAADGAAGHVSARVLQAVDKGHPAASAGLPSCSPVHTALEYWAGQGNGVSQRLAVPKQIVLLDKSLVSAYDVATGRPRDLAELPVVNSSGQTLMAQHIVHSSKKGTVLVFFRTTGWSKDKKISAGDWEFTALAEGAESSALWTAPGSDAAFVGAEEQNYVVLSSDGRLVCIYASQVSDKPPNVLKRIELPAGGAFALFAGPAWGSLPRPDQQVEDDRPGNGVVMWAGRDGTLSLGELVAVVGGHDVTGYYGAPSSRRSRVAAARSLALQPGEGVIQVAWQNLLADMGDASVMDDSGEGKASVVAAVLTSQRVMLVSATLHVLVALPLRPSDPSPTSLLWLGPALLFCNAAHQVKLLSWDGSCAPVCSLGGGPPAVLAGALADRLLVLRGGRSVAGGAHMNPRQLSLLQPLLHGWASLAARGILPGGHWRARREMGKLVQAYDSSTISSQLLGVLLTAGCADVALALAKNPDAPHLGASQQAAMKAAAGQWQDTVQAALVAHQRSIYYPQPPPAGSALWKRLVALGSAAVTYGQLLAARQCWQAAGYWAELLPLCALQADFDGIRSYMALASPEARAMGEQLLAVGKPRFRRASAVGARPLTGDWKVAPELTTGPLAAAAAEVGLQLAPPGSTPAMESPGSAPTDPGAHVPRMDVSALESYLGVGQGPARNGAIQPVADDDPFAEEAGSFANEGTEDGVSTKDGGSSEHGEQRSPAPSAAAASESAQQGAAKDPFGVEKDAFYSSDEEDSKSEATSSTAPSRPHFRIVIRGKDEVTTAAPESNALRSAANNLRLSSGFANFPPPSGPSPSRSGLGFRSDSVSTSASVDQLSDFMSPGSGVRPMTGSNSQGSLAPLGRVAATSGMAASSYPSLAPPPTSFSRQGAPAPSRMIPEDLFGPDPSSPSPPTPIHATSPRMPNPQQASTAASTQARSSAADSQPQEPGPRELPPKAADPATAFKQGISLMETGDWEHSAANFKDALHMAKTPTQVQKAAQYLAAVRLLQEGGDVDLKTGARLQRFAAALRLDDKHKRALVQSAAARNMDVGNYGYAAEQLVWLVAQSTGTASPAYLAQLQQRIKECDERGSRDANVPADEDLATFSEIVGTAASSADVDNCIRPIKDSG